MNEEINKLIAKLKKQISNAQKRGDYYVGIRNMTRIALWAGKKQAFEICLQECKKLVSKLSQPNVSSNSTLPKSKIKKKRGVVVCRKCKGGGTLDLKNNWTYCNKCDGTGKAN